MFPTLHANTPDQSRLTGATKYDTETLGKLREELGFSIQQEKKGNLTVRSSMDGSISSTMKLGDIKEKHAKPVENLVGKILKDNGINNIDTLLPSNAKDNVLKDANKFIGMAFFLCTPDQMNQVLSSPDTLTKFCKAILTEKSDQYNEATTNELPADKLANLPSYHSYISLPRQRVIAALKSSQEQSGQQSTKLSTSAQPNTTSAQQNIGPFKQNIDSAQQNTGSVKQKITFYQQKIDSAQPNIGPFKQNTGSVKQNTA
ncbi:MAG: hypothetical protein LBH49_02665, partial [Puniceicoccales bacterium]|nr:hypothetical protein [Puniceicoccales bacterium]